MLKKTASILSLFLLSFSCLFASTAHPRGPAPASSHRAGPIQRTDLMNPDSPQVAMKLKKAENILSTLVVDPESYHLILSNKTSFGGEALPPYVFSDKPTMIIYQGSLDADRSQEEAAFMIAHELGHLNMYHNENKAIQMQQIFEGPYFGISGVTFNVFHQKLQERQADLFGLHMYHNAGYDMGFFASTLNLVKIDPNLHLKLKNPPKKFEYTLSMKNPHFSLQERFDLLAHEANKLI